MQKIITRADIVKEARSWIGTRFAHQGRVKATGTHRGGCDCIGLVAGVVKALQITTEEGILLADYDETRYSRQPDGNRLKTRLASLLLEIPIETIRPGDLLLFRFDENPQHVGIVGDYYAGGLSLIHAYMLARKVAEHRLDDSWRQKIATAFSLI